MANAKNYLVSGNFHPSPLRNSIQCHLLSFLYWISIVSGLIPFRKNGTLSDICRRQTPVALSRMLQDPWELAKCVQTKYNIAVVRLTASGIKTSLAMYHCERKTSLCLHKETHIISDLQHWIHVPCGSFHQFTVWIYVFDMFWSFHLHHVAMLELDAAS